MDEEQDNRSEGKLVSVLSVKRKLGLCLFNVDYAKPWNRANRKYDLQVYFSATDIAQEIYFCYYNSALVLLQILSKHFHLYTMRRSKKGCKSTHISCETTLVIACYWSCQWTIAWQRSYGNHSCDCCDRCTCDCDRCDHMETRLKSFCCSIEQPGKCNFPTVFKPNQYSHILKRVNLSNLRQVLYSSTILDWAFKLPSTIFEFLVLL